MSLHTDQPNYTPDYTAWTIGSENPKELRKLVRSLQATYQPRNFAEQHLIDEIAHSIWRQRRIMLMQCAIERAEYELRAAELRSDPPADIETRRKNHDSALEALHRQDVRCGRRIDSALQLLSACQAVLNPAPKPRPSVVEAD